MVPRADVRKYAVWPRLCTIRSRLRHSERRREQSSILLRFVLDRNKSQPRIRHFEGLALIAVRMDQGRTRGQATSVKPP